MSNYVYSNKNTETYIKLLSNMMTYHIKKTNPFIFSEVNCKKVFFKPDGIIKGSSENYLRYEFEWYMSGDLCIKNHPGIEKNPIWNNCATNDGYVNSNYGWCVFDKENGEQFKYALEALISDEDSRRAEIIYTRPSIHEHQNDGKHAKQDMMCTNYTMFMIRDNHLKMHVHMRSNDAWHGLRYDLAWQIYVYNKMYDELRKKYTKLKKSNILWIADSLHIYRRDVSSVKEFLYEDITRSF